MWARPESVPIERLLKNAQLAISKNPKNAELRYFHARINSLAFALNTQTVDLYKSPEEGQSEYVFPSYANIQQAREKKGVKLSERDLVFLRKSLNEYQASIKLKTTNPLAKIGFAWMHEEGAPYASQVGQLPWISKKPLTSQAMRNKAAEIYRMIYLQHKDIEQKSVMMGLPSEKPGAEAGRSLLRLFEMGVPARKGEAESIKATVAKIDTCVRRDAHNLPHWSKL